mmetsp:Transcript_16081/g.50279  ORF Transcript_16081/g.50279 Transcript_16081/m.50279 type:complete len:249 (-) Transcript_16081:553-1299(-)
MPTRPCSMRGNSSSFSGQCLQCCGSCGFGPLTCTSGTGFASTMRLSLSSMCDVTLGTSSSWTLPPPARSSSCPRRPSTCCPMCSIHPPFRRPSLGLRPSTSGCCLFLCLQQSLLSSCVCSYGQTGGYRRPCGGSFVRPLSQSPFETFSFAINWCRLPLCWATSISHCAFTVTAPTRGLETVSALTSTRTLDHCWRSCRPCGVFCSAFDVSGIQAAPTCGSSPTPASTRWPFSSPHSPSHESSTKIASH